jgi:lipoprotein-releasing system ATP-binding protein
MSNPILTAENISKSFHDGDNNLEILKCLDFYLEPGEKVAILGSSGSGKSTLLHILAGLDQPSAGRVKLDDKNLSHLSENKLAKIRNKSLGFIYQFHHLLPEFTAIENIAMPLLIAGKEFEEAFSIATKYLKDVDLENRANHKPAQLSGGERQRVAIARALVNNPKCVLADEPTGNLDEKNAQNVFELLLELNKKYKTSMVLVTHDKLLAEKLDKVYMLNHGKLILQ